MKNVHSTEEHNSYLVEFHEMLALVIYYKCQSKGNLAIELQIKQKK
jgi:hypothetical protein